MQDMKPWAKGRLIKRYKRFLADVETSDGNQITIHCPNTGSMRNCIAEGSACWYSESDSKTRKYPHTWEVATTPEGDLAGINTNRANHLVREALVAGVVKPLAGFEQLRSEVKYGNENSRIDFLLTGAHGDCYVEVKNVTLKEQGCGYFPDAVSTRGVKHLRELMHVKALGHRAVLLFCVQHSGIDRVKPADHIDSTYGAVLREAQTAGVELLAYSAELCPAQSRIELTHEVPVELE
ncbi:DNA/RNA nuclease SfsA [Gilvimarinus sp. SDUM040013]|uniref:Sugar fermentation stimulation protein homolog n=1 Tax=Gilvimarinus gilvus TaxID=3058038 RepID=A0ABU4S0C4_9GAMM|nr:DNA/RNA nuclease SfsA [Gilvimarinus sp. SDUM040013]MDO3386105.1 DNA/RNA nuclease SfsA [Gilvimarinus sp. SDUM040013]MDX6850354.1 DNA/RNA nuclease SfsA [Gilvimarinus sp. SDUM040013]